MFTNPNDENSIDADELLLALTEEWGDREASQKRREELEQQKTEKIKEAQTLQMKGYLKNLSLARGALEALGKGQTKEHKKRRTQIGNIEVSLKGSPVFTRKDIIESTDAFLYNGNTGDLFRTGDVIGTRGGTYVVESINFKKQELSCKPLLSNSEKTERETQARQYGTYIERVKQFKLSELTPEGGSYSSSALLFHAEKASGETKEILKNAGSKEFYRLPEEAKKAWYETHVKTLGERYGRYDPVVFYRNEGGVLELQRAHNDAPENAVLLNPFSQEGRDAVRTAMKNGIVYNRYDPEGIIDTLRETVPDLAGETEKAIKQEEKAEAERKAAEREKRLEKEFRKTALSKTNPDRDHIKKHARMVSSRGM